MYLSLEEILASLESRLPVVTLDWARIAPTLEGLFAGEFSQNRTLTLPKNIAEGTTIIIDGAFFAVADPNKFDSSIPSDAIYLVRRNSLPWSGACYLVSEEDYFDRNLVSHPSVFNRRNPLLAKRDCQPEPSVEKKITPPPDTRQEVNLQYFSAGIILLTGEFFLIGILSYLYREPLWLAWVAVAKLLVTMFK